jgi:hypothetical protein
MDGAPVPAKESVNVARIKVLFLLIRLFVLAIVFIYWHIGEA